MDLQNVLAANIRRLRQECRLTQEDLAAKSGLSARYVGAIERADVSASIKVLERVAAAFGVDPAELLMSPIRRQSDS